jgi:4-hydroxybenzoate polyprenyltransferase
LLIMVFTLCCMRYFVIQPVLGGVYFPESLFWVMVAGTFFIAAAGYIINDYFDLKTDIINHPETVVIDRAIKRRVAMLMHLVFNGIGLVLGVWLSWRCHSFLLLSFQVLAITLLWFYSTDFKKQLLTGNIIIALLTATIPFMPLAYTYLKSSYDNPLFSEQHHDQLKILFIITFLYCGFAFLTSLIREIVKDMEDFKGDIQTGCKTMPISWGIISTKVFTFFMIVITIGILLFSILKLWQWHQKPAAFYLVMTVLFPLLLLILLVIRAKTPQHFKMASLLLKFIMLFGIAFTFLIKLVYEQH